MPKAGLTYTLLLSISAGSQSSVFAMVAMTFIVMLASPRSILPI